MIKYFHLLDTHTGEVFVSLWNLSSACSSSELLLPVASESKASCRPLSTAWLERLNSLSSVQEIEAVDDSSQDRWGLLPTCGGSALGCMESRLSKDTPPVWQCLLSPSSCWLQCSKACSPSRVCNLLCSLKALLCSPVCLESCSSSTARDTGCSELNLPPQGHTEAGGRQFIPAMSLCVNVGGGAEQDFTSPWVYEVETLVRVREEWCTSTPSGPHAGAALCPCSRQASWLLCSGTGTKNMSGTPGKTEATWWESLRPLLRDRRLRREPGLGRSTISHWLAVCRNGESTGLAETSRGGNEERFSHIFWRSPSSVDLIWESSSVLRITLLSESFLTKAGGEDRWMPWPSFRIFVRAGAITLS